NQVRFAQHCRLDRIGDLVRQGQRRERQRRRSLVRQCEPPRMVAFDAELAQGVTQATVLYECPVLEATRESIVVHDERRVLLLDASALERVVALEVIPGPGALDVLRERLSL